MLLVRTLAWSPDGTRLAYVDGSRSGGKISIWVAPMDGSAPAEIGSPSLGSPLAQQCLNDRLCIRELTWSPDGSRIAVRTSGHSFENGEGKINFASAIDADGSGDAERIDELTYRSWDGGGYSCEC